MVESYPLTKPLLHLFPDKSAQSLFKMPSKRKPSTFPITVHTMEAELKFHIAVSHVCYMCWSHNCFCRFYL